MDDWHKIADRPPAPMGVEMYYGKWVVRDQNGIDVELEPYRDFRRSLGYWDGETFREQNTGHDCFESWRHHDQQPTHWRELPPPPNL